MFTTNQLANAIKSFIGEDRFGKILTTDYRGHYYEVIFKDNNGEYLTASIGFANSQPKVWSVN